MRSREGGCSRPGTGRLVVDGLIAERPGRLEITDDAAPAAPSSARQIRRSLLVASSLAVDLLAVVAAYLICWAIRIEPRGSQPLAISLLSRTTLITVPLWLVVFASYDLYDRRALSAAS